MTMTEEMKKMLEKFMKYDKGILAENNKRYF